MTADTDWARLYVGVSLIDCDSPEVLDELLNTSAIGDCIVQRLSDRTIVVDAQRKTHLLRALARRGHPYRLVDLAPAEPALPTREPRA